VEKVAFAAQNGRIGPDSDDDLLTGGRWGLLSRRGEKRSGGLREKVVLAWARTEGPEWWHEYGQQEREFVGAS
jgi:hypothetical protein